MDEGEFFFFCQFAGVVVGFRVRIAYQYSFGATRFYRINLDGRRGGRHHDGRRATEFLRRQCHACAWLPAEAAITPRFSTAVGRLTILL